jgi:hypothetical protein
MAKILFKTQSELMLETRPRRRRRVGKQQGARRRTG